MKSRLHSLIVAVTLAMLTGDLSGQTRTEMLFEPVAATDLSPAQAEELRKLTAQSSVASSQLIDLDASALDAALLGLPVEPGQPYVASSNAHGTWKASPSTPSLESVSLFRGPNGNVTGTIRTEEGLFSIRPLGAGAHVLLRHDEAAFPPEHPPQDPAADERPSARAGQDPELSVLVLYPATAGFADPGGLAGLAVQETNEGLRGTGIEGSVILAGVEPIEITEAGSMKGTLERLIANGQARRLRDQKRADIVLMIVRDTSYCGMAADILPESDSAFGVVSEGCATGYYSFAHEIGHLLGTRHDVANDSSATPFAHGHGFVNAKCGTRTIMGLECKSGCRRINQWSSNPGTGTCSLGDPGTADNARVLRDMISVASRYK